MVQPLEPLLATYALDRNNNNRNANPDPKTSPNTNTNFSSIYPTD